jgi:hypothetical protein
MRQLLVYAISIWVLSSSVFASQLGRGREGETLASGGLNQGAWMLGRVAGDGPTRVASWVVHDSFSSSEHTYLYVGVSQDAGLSWTRTLLRDEVVFNYGSVWIQDLEYSDDRGLLVYQMPNSNMSVLAQSSPFAETWRPSVASFDGFLELAARGKDALVVEESLGEVRIRQSSNSGSSWSQTGSLTVPGLAEIYSASAALSGSGACVVFAAETFNDPDIGLYFSARRTNGNWSSPLRLDADPHGTSSLVKYDNVKVFAENGRIIVNYRQTGRAGAGALEKECYLLISEDAGQSWNETMVSVPGEETTDYIVATEGDTIVAAWVGDSAHPRTRVLVSNDGGDSFMPVHSIERLPGEPAVPQARLQVFLDGARLFLGYMSGSWTGKQHHYSPGYVYSVDSGQCWSDPVWLRPGEEAIFSRSEWHYSEGGLLAFYHTYNSRWDFTELRWTGVRFPLIQAVHRGPGEVALYLTGADPSQPKSFARWVASTRMGKVPHPENPAYQLGLGPSRALVFTHAHHVKYGSRVHSDGSALAVVTVPASLSGTYYFQAWVNIGGILGTGGTPTSDVFELTF